MRHHNSVLPDPHRPHEKRPTIGFLTDSISNDAGQALWSGITAAAREFDLNMICFPGRCLRDPREFQAQANILYDLVAEENVDGLVSFASSIGSNVSALVRSNRARRNRVSALVAGSVILQEASTSRSSWGSTRTPMEQPR